MQVRAGLELWADRAGAVLRIEDDRSDPERAARLHAELQAAGCRFVLGPYRSDTTRACSGRGRGGWNHGAAADDVQRMAAVVSVSSPASRFLVALGRVVAELRAGARVAIAAGRGRFARLAAEGLEARGRVARAGAARPLPPHRPGGTGARPPTGRGPRLRPAPAGGGPHSRAGGALAADAPGRRFPGDPRLPASAGRRPRRLPRPRPVAQRPRSRARARAAVRGGAEGRSRLRPAGAGLPRRAGLRRGAGRRALRALAPEDPLLAARKHTTSTFFGPFRLDPRTGLQRGHRLSVVRWTRGRQELLLAEAA